MYEIRVHDLIVENIQVIIYLKFGKVYFHLEIEFKSSMSVDL